MYRQDDNISVSPLTRVFFSL